MKYFLIYTLMNTVSNIIVAIGQSISFLIIITRIIKYDGTEAVTGWMVALIWLLIAAVTFWMHRILKN